MSVIQQYSYKEIFEMVKSHKITPEEGLRLLKTNKTGESDGKMEALRVNLEGKTDLNSKGADKNSDQLLQKAKDYLKQLLSEYTKIPISQIHVNDSFEEYGIDSIMAMNLTRKLEEDFREISKTLFFEYQTIDELAGYFANHYPEKFMFDDDKDNNKTKDTAKEDFPRVYKEQKPTDASRPRFITSKVKGTNHKDEIENEVAIIGISGRYPMASNLNEFWENLKAAKDCIIEIPATRWDLWKYYNPDKNIPGNVYCKWGGFIEDVDKFDPLFFNISPREAEFIDPQERLFLETVWHTLEDAGLTRGSLSGQKAGVFVGVLYSEYQFFGNEITLKGFPAATNSSHASIANRISYFFNFSGPSMAIDTMCSSSLTALHLAYESIKRKECDIAIAGGVNISIHPQKYILLSQSKFASSDGRCRSFGADGDGYVPGEGVGAVLLKPLSKAVLNNDHIYGIIKGCGINHGGKTNGYAVPNPNAQADLIKEVLIKANINPRTISYIEAHGTGTALGDPIEITGLTKAYSEFTSDKQFCAIGSVKSNIGHLESAAGIASLTKVLLQFKHKKILPSIHSEKLNPNINFTKTPFFVQKELADWNLPVSADYPRLAGISGFGAGGSNVHIILEEYDGSEIYSKTGKGIKVCQKTENIDFRESYIFPLSAKNDERLKVYAEQMVKFLEENNSLSLADLAYTFQAGRESMDVRIAAISNQISGLKEKLSQYLKGQSQIDGLFRGNIKNGIEQSSVLLEGNAGKEFIKGIIKENETNKLAQLWASGINIDWNVLYPDEKPKRISAPGYPFKKDRYWVTEISQNEIADQSESLPGNIYFCSKWENLNIKPAENFLLSNGSVLLFDYDESLLSHLKANFNENFKANFILIKPGEGYQKSGDNVFEINPEKESDYAELLMALKNETVLPSYIIHMWSKTDFNYDISILSNQIKNSFFSIYYFSKALMEQKISQKIKLLYFYSEQSENSNPQYAALAGFAKTIRLENPNYIYKVISLQNVKQIKEIILTEFENDNNDIEIRYVNENRQVKRLYDLKNLTAPIQRPLIRNDGVYLITGGAGGLGFILADFLTKNYKVRIILTGRSDLDEEQNQKIKRLNDNGSEVIYIKGDISQREDAESLTAQIINQFHEINGVFHGAGIIRDAFVLKKDIAAINAVIAPKVFGTIFLDEFTKNEPIEIFMLFSSVAAILGSVGQSDYAFANSFMDGFAEVRNKLVEKKERSGKTISINWPLWEDGGMKLSHEAQLTIAKQTGIKPLPSKDGINALITILQNFNVSQCMVLYGNKEKIMNVYGSIIKEDVTINKNLRSAGSISENSLQKIENILKDKISDILKIPYKQIDSRVNLKEYGIDSVMINQFNAEMEKVFGPLPKTLLFEYQTLKDLAKYLIGNYEEGCEKYEVSSMPRATSYQPRATSHELRANSHEPRATSHELPATSHQPPPIAIIGLGGRYPMSQNISEYWENLADGKDCITEIPEYRWDYTEFYDPDPLKSEEGNIYCKWGSFLEDADKFDPLFFNISPGEAILMDPQERIFLEIAWETTEDAGYSRNKLNRYIVGVFAGVTSNTYMLWGPHVLGTKEKSLPQSLPWSIANRVSYCFNFQGPSLVVDTACSASLSAIHLACDSIRKGECQIALAGGVNLYLHPIKYIQLCQSGMLSPSGKCKSFGKDSDGFVPGEGVGAVLLKPLDLAISDHDHIYGIIKGSSLNHGGRTTGYTVPNPISQASLISDTLKKSGIDPRTISYIEAHGTGTRLGDPVEVRGLTLAYQRYTKDKKYCALGSVKSNIGHLESAAGIAGLTKILLQLKNKKLAPSLHCESLNPNIDFESTPFYIQKELSDWNNTVVYEKGLEKAFPRRASISSFGAGGANAHLICEEYTGAPVLSAQQYQADQLFVLSAKNKERLKAYASLIAQFIRKYPLSSLSDIAYTLQTGREAMEERLSIVVSSIEELKIKLDQFLNGLTDIENLFSGNARSNQNSTNLLIEGEAGDAFINVILKNHELSSMARLWVNGLDIDFNLLYKDSFPNIISLPTYPFEKERYWIGENNENDSFENDFEKFKSLENQPLLIDDQEELFVKTGQFIKEIMAALLKLPFHKIDDKKKLEEYGIDSIIINRFNIKIEELLGQPIPKTLLFEYPNLYELSHFFAVNYKSALINLFGLTSHKIASPVIHQQKIKSSKVKSRSSTTKRITDSQPIAIIGVSGRYPFAENIDEYWGNLKNGKDCITEIPVSRWDCRDYYDPDPKNSFEGKIYCKWGGFIDDADKFDPLFFNISPNDAELIDPQERLFLENAWETMEDAGYTRKRLNQFKVGVFAGVTTNTYLLWGPEIRQSGVNSIPVSMPWSIANRVSYFFNFNGPSFPVDTACSSSLSAIHLACESIKNGECDLAIAGGINLYLHPSKYVHMCQIGMLSPTGKCKSFGANADGFVPGEGVGAVLLKPLSAATTDGDLIYAIIKGSCVNHGGKTNGYTVPNPNAHADLILDTIRRSGINPRTISYIEAHGTGTSLGDPVEIRGLTKAFREFTSDSQFCAVGSVKSNIGHLESAAGIAGITKILLQMKHKMIVRSLNCDTLNPNIDFENSPFYIQKTNTEWEQPEIKADNKEIRHPRRASISGFGAGGVNVHIILEEYCSQQQFTANRQPPTVNHKPALIVLSARSADRLKIYAAKLYEFIQRHKDDYDNKINFLFDIAYTLQIGREVMRERLAILASDLEDLKEKLSGIANGDLNIANIYYGNRKTTQNKFLLKSEENKEKESVENIVKDKNLKKIAELWVSGVELDWELLYPEQKPHRISLPAYPFLKERFWIPVEAKILNSKNITQNLRQCEKLHPLLDTNISTLNEQKFIKRFTGCEFVFNDHVVANKKTLPGAAFLEMAFAAGGIACEKKVSKIAQAIWIKPIQVSDEPIEVFINFYPNRDKIDYEISTFNEDKQRQIHSQGKLITGENFTEVKKIDIKSIMSRTVEKKTSEQIYQLYEQSGLNYGRSFKTIQELYFSQNEVLSLINLPYHLNKNFSEFTLHPSLIDGAFQTVIGLINSDKPVSLGLPFILSELVFLRPLKEKCYVYASPLAKENDSQIKSFNLYITDDEGNVLVYIKKFSIRSPSQYSKDDRQPQTSKGETLHKSELSQNEILCNLQKDLIAFISLILKINKNQIDIDEDISEYGFDSISFTALANRINEKHNFEITPAIFFEHHTIRSLTEHLFEKYQHVLANIHDEKVKSISRLDKHENITFVSHSLNNEPTAIIGISGMMPQSEDLEQFWNHLVNGDDLITEVPKDRWDWQEYYGDPKKEPNKTKSRWGGFIPDVDKFDSLFFGISPREAELMDPQARLFLQTVWKAVEDAGYKPSDLAGTNTGLFVGVAMKDYAELLGKHISEIDAYASTSMAHSVLANRISYILDLHGPSEPIDTACSSSLIAIHRAFEAIHSGSCEMAIAGGVNVMLTPTATIAFDKAGMLSPDGRCKTFDKNADGYVRGEGVGAVLLKPLSRAVKDNDHIYAVILNTSENHGGHATSLTAPNPKAQAELIVSAYEKAGISPDTISYIETHGTGTNIGDPVEINGLKMAFEKLHERYGRTFWSDMSPYCGLGSVKTNIGHLETAAGIASLLKVILAMKYRKIPGNIHYKEQNPYIKLENTPFYIVSDCRDWELPKNFKGEKVLRRAGISSFGYGGANAHIVIEEYPRATDNQPPAMSPQPQAIILLSAKNEGRLKDYAEKLADFVENKVLPLTDIAYTLQTGRASMEERLAMIVSNVSKLKEKLREYASTNTNNSSRNQNRYFSGNVKTTKHISEILIEGKEGREFVSNLIANKNLEKIAKLWVSGIDINWNLFYQGQMPKRVSLPTYPFAKQRHWVSTSNNNKSHNFYNHKENKIHPLLTYNSSTFSEEKFTTVLNGNEFYLADHIIGGNKILPGVAYIEMARAAGSIASEKEVKKIVNIVWISPIIVMEKPVEVSICLYPENRTALFEIITIGQDKQRSIHAQGKIIYEDDTAINNENAIDINSVMNRCPNIINKQQFYEKFKISGFNYGSSFMTIQKISDNGKEALSLLSIPESLMNNFNAYLLHPSLLDGALQTVSALTGKDFHNLDHFLPFSLGSIMLINPLTHNCYAYAISKNSSESDEIKRFDIKILGETGSVLLEIKDYTIKALRRRENVLDDNDDNRLLNLFKNLASGAIDTHEAKNMIKAG